MTRVCVRESQGLWKPWGLVGRWKDRTETYSSGMKQKLSLARVRMMDPKLLLMDEPTANLDPVSADTLLAAVRAESSLFEWNAQDVIHPERPLR